MKPRLEPALYTEEDRDIWACVGLWRCFALNDALEMASAIGDRRDAEAMLVMVELHASRVIQAQTGDWCYFGHSTQSVFSNETLQ